MLLMDRMNEKKLTKNWFFFSTCENLKRISEGNVILKLVKEVFERKILQNKCNFDTCGIQNYNFESQIQKNQ